MGLNHTVLIVDKLFPTSTVEPNVSKWDVTSLVSMDVTFVTCTEHRMIDLPCEERRVKELFGILIQ